MKPRILRRLKEDVAKEVPPKSTHTIMCELSLLQKQLYRQILTQNFQVREVAMACGGGGDDGGGGGGGGSDGGSRSGGSGDL